MRTGYGIALAALLALAAAGGWWARTWTAPAAGGGSVAAGGDGPCPGGAEPLHWKAPMDPTYVRDEPGKSPMGMDLVPVCPGGGGAEGEVRIDPSLVQSMGVRTAPVERRDLSRTLRTVGRVALDERRVAHVHTKVQGWVERLFVEYEGERVERGEALLQIYSPALVSTQEELLLAARYREATTGSPFEDVARGGEDLLRATRRRLELWDVSERDIERLLETGEVRKTLTLHAPTGGVVTHLMVRDGMEVSPNDNLYTIADLSRVWLYADVYEYELPWVAEGQRAFVDLSYLPGRTFEGEVTYVYPLLDPETRTARVRIELDNPERVLKPDMYADVRIQTRTREDVLTVPDEAVIRSGRRSLVIVALGDGRFAPREVELGIESGQGRVEVQEGLEVGERVVTSGQFLIDSESRLQEAMQKLDDSEAPARGPASGQDPHEGHEMPDASDAAAPHAGHDMPDPDAPAADPHSGHAMPMEDAGSPGPGAHPEHAEP